MVPDTENPTSLGDSLTRRRVIGILGMAAVGFFGGTSQTQAFMDFFGSYSPASPATLAKWGIPAEWSKQLGPLLPAYAAFLKEINLRSMSVKEVIECHNKKRGSVQNTLPPRAMWRNIRSTLKVIDSLSNRLDHNVSEVVSVYRSPAYNARCNGAKSNSYHLRNNAIDIRFDCPPGKVAAMARAMRSTGLFRGGVGRYGSFTHVDTRGNNADW